MGLKPNLYDPYLYSGFIINPSNPTDIPSKVPLTVDLYVDDFVFFSKDAAVESKFQNILSKLVPVDFMGTVKWFLGVHFLWDKSNTHLSVHLNQAGFAQNLVESFDRHTKSHTPNSIPYRSGLPIDAFAGHDPLDKSPPQ